MNYTSSSRFFLSFLSKNTCWTRAYCAVRYLWSCEDGVESLGLYWLFCFTKTTLYSYLLPPLLLSSSFSRTLSSRNYLLVYNTLYRFAGYVYDPVALVLGVVFRTKMNKKIFEKWRMRKSERLGYRMYFIFNTMELHLNGIMTTAREKSTLRCRYIRIIIIK